MSAKSEFNNLCVRCSQIVAKAETLFATNTQEARNDFYPFPQWRKNASWCHICALSFHQADDDCIATLQTLWDRGEGINAIVHVKISATTRQNSLSILFRCNIYPILAQIYCASFQGEASLDISLPSRCSRTWDTNSKQQVLKWLDQCKNHHTVCNASHSVFRSQEARRRPKRVLQIEYGDTENNHLPDSINTPQTCSIRLRDTNGLPDNLSYLTLSHCWGYHPTVAWGRHPALTLTNEVLDEFYRHVPLLENTSPESRTFKDAVGIVRDLGHHFLWIDALCINQDDPKDKADEISVMDEIYANADFNLSATASSSGSGGLVYTRNPISFEPFRKMTYLEGRQQSEIIVYSNRWRQEVDCGHVNSRAWVFQERILAPRIVHFAQGQVFWECASLKAAQCFPNGMPYGVQSTGPREHLKNWLEVDKLDDLEDWETVQEIWASLVALYTQTNLSFQQDKLPAISGVARRLQKLCKASGSEYLAGLWQPNLIGQLLWKVEPSPSRGRPTSYRAPSWSWASHDAVTYLNTRPAKSCAVGLVAVKVQTKTSDPFGEISSASITLSGPLCSLNCSKGSNGDLQLVINGRSHPRQLIQTNWDCIPAGSDTQESIIFSKFPVGKICLMAFYPYPERAENLFGMTGLILQQTGEKAGQYSRLGVFKLWQRYHEAHDILVEAFQSKTLDDDAYLNFDGKDRYRIEVI